METFGAVIVAAGSSTRMGKPKQFLPLCGKPVLQRTVEIFAACEKIEKIAVVTRAEDIEKVRTLLPDCPKNIQVVPGGETRQQSVLCGVRALCKGEAPAYVAIHDGARPLLSEQDLLAVLADAVRYGAAAICMPVFDTVKKVDADGFIACTEDRNVLRLMATPQVFATQKYLQAVSTATAAGKEFTDDCQLLEFAGEKVYLTMGSRTNIKLTTPEDLQTARAYLPESEEKKMRIGHGYDVHKLVEGRKLILGGVEIPYEKGLLGHSDADVLLHAISDALLGAAAIGDIGKLFPDNDPAYEGADSLVLLEKVWQTVNAAGYTVGNMDCTVLAQRPKLAPYREQMRENIAKACHCSINCVSVKATTEEGLGFTGKGEGIAAHAVCLLEK